MRHIRFPLALAGVALSALALTCFNGCSRRSASAAASEIPSDANFQKQLDDAYDYAGSRRLNINDQGAWQIIHGAEAFGKDFLITADGKEVHAIDYVTHGGAMKGWDLRPTEHGVISIVANDAIGMGHIDQWLGYLSQCGVKMSDPLLVGGKDYTMKGFVDNAKWDIDEDPKRDGTWTLMAFITYLPMDVEWTNHLGEKWNLERLVAMEVRKTNDEIYSTEACGGAHCLYSLALAVNRYKREMKTTHLTGAWKEAEDHVIRAVRDAKDYQNTDGTISSNSFIKANPTPDVAQQIRTTGHVLEFLSVACSDEEFNEPWMSNVAYSLVKLFQKTKNMDIECGALYHSAHGLKLYRERRFGLRPSLAADISPTDESIAAQGAAAAPTKSETAVP
ncbi:MAG TPA: hypothetical protein VFE24_13005 [Pirellulales bacterium]|nr:hypothetical protein [Pirellulales bacterium]